ncbi:MAG: hypothetical protein C0510_04650 [Erythrobacter sp.]|nr:hypothetical protein [Erythrobacter sp.]
MANIDESESPPIDRRFFIAMLLLAIGSTAYLFYGASFDYIYAGYGALFAIPFALGALVSQVGLLDYRLAGCLLAPIALFAVIFPFVYFGLAEGLVCILMVLPIWIAAGLGGALAAYLIRRQQQVNDRHDSGDARLRASAWLILPFALVFAEEMSPPQWETRNVERDILIEAAPESIWPLLVSIPDIGANEGLPNMTQDFLGVARPRAARLTERDGKLIRLARWGEDIRFEELITNIEKNARISWQFAFPDDSIQRYTDQHIAPDGPILKIDRGGYELERVGPNMTRLRLTTSYHMRSRLGWYIGWWGEKLLGDVQENVLAIVRQRAERPLEVDSV